LTFGGGLACVIAALWDWAMVGVLTDFWEWLVRGSTLLLVGLIGEYVGRIYSLLNGAPQYVVARRAVETQINLSEERLGKEKRGEHEAA
jgi:hypothetical protein